MAHPPHVPQRAAWVLVVLVSTGVLGAAFGCSQIIGADQNRTLASTQDSTPPIVPGSDGDASQAPTQTVTPCSEGKKRCNGACVVNDDPQYGCDPVLCGDPCSLPHAASAKCETGECAVATCAPGWSDCNGVGADGCEGDTTLPATCNLCGTACLANYFCGPPTVGNGCTPDCTATFGSSVVGCPDGRCVSEDTNVHDCGGCSFADGGGTGQSCDPLAPANSDATCDAGKCDFVCHEGFADCNSNRTCVPLTAFYPDVDGDGYGDNSGSTAPVLACANAPPPNTAPNATDCDDANPSVFGGQTSFFAVPYTTPAGKSTFDYNCDNVEEGQPGVIFGGRCAPTCASGYVATGSTANAYCGSATTTTCQASSQPQDQASSSFSLTPQSAPTGTGGGTTCTTSNAPSPYLCQ